MLTPNKSPKLAVTRSGLENQTHVDNTTPPQKWARVLRALLTGRSFNRFEAARELSDHCLHSTVAGLSARCILILRHSESVPGFAGCPTQVMRYQLDRTPENINRAATLLNANVARRGCHRPESIGGHHPARVDGQKAR